MPPIVVHRATMRVIDGMHRVRAAKLRGAAHVAAILGSDRPCHSVLFTSSMTTRRPVLASEAGQDGRAAAAAWATRSPQSLLVSSRRVTVTSGAKRWSCGYYPDG